MPHWSAAASRWAETAPPIAARPFDFHYLWPANPDHHHLHGTSDFIGAIYASEANLTLGGGGNAPTLMGAAIVKSGTMNGHYAVHYDEALQTGARPKVSWPAPGRSSSQTQPG